MSNSNIVSIINNLIDKKLIASKPSQADAIEATVDSAAEYVVGQTLVQDEGTAEESILPDNFYDIFPEDWQAPPLSEISIAPFSPIAIATPINLSLSSQSIQLSSDGGVTVTAIISCDDVNLASEYEFRISEA